MTEKKTYKKLNYDRLTINVYKDLVKRDFANNIIFCFKSFKQRVFFAIETVTYVTIMQHKLPCQCKLKVSILNPNELFKIE